MLSFVVRRLGYTVFVLLAVSVVVFGIIQTTPGDPIALMLGAQATPEIVERLRSQMGYDRPVVIQYFSWLGGVLRGDFGTALRDSAPVLPSLLGRVPATLILIGASTMIALLIGIPLGVLSAIRVNSPIDALSRFLSLIGVSMPSFWLGVMLIYVFAYLLRWLPASGYESWRHLILPALSLGLVSSALIMRLTRSSMLEVLGKDYIRTARAKGVTSFSVTFRHALRNSLIPVITVVGLQMGYLIGGSVAVETVFSWPGLGLYSYQRLMQRDYPMIMGSLLIYAFMFALINLLVDLLYGWVDPRIRYE